MSDTTLTNQHTTNWESANRLGAWMRARREEARLTASACARRAGMSSQQWSDLENGRSRVATGKPSAPKAKTIHKIAEGLAVTVEEVMAAANLDVSVYGREIRRELYTETSIFLKEVGKRLRARREYLGMSQAEVSTAANLDKGSVSHYEAGMVDIPCSKLARLAQVLKVPVSYLVEGESFAPQEIQLAQHTDAFIAALSNPKVRMLITETLAKTPSSSPDSHNAATEPRHRVTKFKKL